MKKTSIFYRCLNATTALFVATALSMGFTACSDELSDSKSGFDPELAKNIIGTWHTSYAKKGQVTLSNGETWTYVKGVQALTFNNDGTGTCSKFLCDAAGEPLSLFGGTGDAVNGRFHYTVDKSNVITITRDGDGDADNPKTWILNIAEGVIRGADGADTYLMKSADADWQAYITNLEKTARSGDNKDQTSPEFLTNWQAQEVVALEGIANPQYTPWAGNRDDDIPENIRFDVQKEAGWEMAFCTLNDPNAEGLLFMGLYNRYTGLLRVFSYIPTSSTSAFGKELGYLFNAADKTGLPHYLFYNSMEYAIPVCHDYNDPNTFDTGITLITKYGDQQVSYRPFETMISAYTKKTSVGGVSTGWHCTDFDLSGYTPNGIHWTDNCTPSGGLLGISYFSQDISEVSLAGTLLGSIDGTFVDPQYETFFTGNQQLSQATGVISALTGTYNGIYQSTCMFNMAKNAAGMKNGIKAGKPADQIMAQPAVDVPIIPDNMLANGEVQPAVQPGPVPTVRQPTRAGAAGPGAAMTTFYAGSLGLNLITCAMNIANQYAGAHQATRMVNPGKINMTLDAKIDLSGTITSWKSLPLPGVKITPNLLKEVNETKDTVWMGSGCFGLAQDPVIYVSKEDLLSVSSSISIEKNDDDTYASVSWENDSVRLVHFLDPTSIKVCLNPDVYHNIRDVNLTINYGVISSREVGNTDLYRKMLKLNERPTFTLNPDNQGLLTTATTPMLHVMTKDRTIKNDFFASSAPESLKLDYLDSDSKLPLYGRFEKIGEKTVIMDPQVFVPFDPESNVVKNPEIPDFVVTVTVAFECDECPNGVIFSKLYLPQIELIGHDDLKAHYDRLKDYADKCDKSEVVDHLYEFVDGNAKENSIPVYNEMGKIMLGKTLDVLLKCF